MKKLIGLVAVAVLAFSITACGGSTVALVDNYEAIQSFAEGKTIAELEAAIDGKSATEVVDAVSGATLVDTIGYLENIIEAAKAAK